MGSQTALAQPLPACCTVLDKSNETHALQLLIKSVTRYKGHDDLTKKKLILCVRKGKFTFPFARGFVLLLEETGTIFLYIVRPRIFLVNVRQSNMLMFSNSCFSAGLSKSYNV